MERPVHDQRRSREAAPAPFRRDALLADDGLWLGGEALVAPTYWCAPPAAAHADDDYADPSWQVI